MELEDQEVDTINTTGPRPGKLSFNWDYIPWQVPVKCHGKPLTCFKFQKPNTMCTARQQVVRISEPARTGPYIPWALPKGTHASQRCAQKSSHGSQILTLSNKTASINQCISCIVTCIKPFIYHSNIISEFVKCIQCDFMALYSCFVNRFSQL